MKISKKIKLFVLKRANFICEYCLIPASHSPQPFNGEHITPQSKDGSDDMDNLASSCGGCNSHKYNKTHAPDPFDGKMVALFHPRQMQWYQHFTWSSDCTEVIGLTDTGRATVKTLHLNRIGLKNLRKLLLKEGLHPPK